MVTILIAGSDANMVGSLSSALTDAGYAVIEARTGLAALTTMAACTDPLIAVLDMRLPDLDGADIVRFARSALPMNRRLCMVLMAADTAAAPPEARIKVDDPFVQVLGKPYTRDDLLTAVRTAEWLICAEQPERAELAYYG